MHQIPSEHMAEQPYNIEELSRESSSKKNERGVIKEIPENKTSKKDRHSKIETAHGPRDRRMRLSIQVARDFFDLQDTLGHNKASKTIEWLISKSKADIKDLTSSSNANCPFKSTSPSSISNCEVVSQEKGKHLVSPTKETKNTRGSTRKPLFNTLAKESRDKARARARERTREKIKVDVLKIGPETTMITKMNPLGNWHDQNQNNCPQFEVFDDVREPSSSMNFNSHIRKSRTSQEHQIRDFNPHGKP